MSLFALFASIKFSIIVIRADKGILTKPSKNELPVLKEKILVQELHLQAWPSVLLLLNFWNLVRPLQLLQKG